MHMNEVAPTAAPATWQGLLEEIVQQLGTQERQQLYKTVGVNRIAVRRWILGENAPNGKHLTALIGAVPPHYREPLRVLLMQDPKMKKLLPSLPAESPAESPSRDSIPQRVYEKVLRASRDTPDRFWILCGLILLEALHQ